MCSLRVKCRRQKLSLTPLIDVIFLLLLFFMLSSTFSRFGELKMDLGGRKNPQTEIKQTEAKLLFLRLNQEGGHLNGFAMHETPLKELVEQMREADQQAHLVISIVPGANSQDLVNALYQSKGIKNLVVTVVK